jgi:hypothetical protein
VTYEWDPRKAHANRRKHGVSFEEAASVFQDAEALTFDDPDQSDDESREMTIGISTRGRVLFVSHCARGERIWIIIARKATSRERKQYGEGLI